MSFTVDANVLLYASDLDSPHHERATTLLAQWVAGHEVVYLAWPVLMAYLRISTHPSVFAAPLTPAEARGNVASLLAVPHVRLLGEGAEFWTCYCRATDDVPVRGNLVPDAHVVALMLEHGVREIVTNDSDYRKFGGIRVRNPFA